MTKIHMETENIQATIQSMQHAVIEMDELVQRLKRSRSLLQSNWQGGSRSSKFFSSMNVNVQQISASCHQLDSLGRRLTSEMWQWIEADSNFPGIRNFGSGTQTGGVGKGQAPVLGIPALQELVCGSMSGEEKTTCELIWSKPPGNAQQLAYMIMNLPDSMPIVIMQIGEGEYLVLMRGTVSGKDEGHNWGSAFEAMFVNSSYQNSVIDALNNANLPAGAKLNFAGHSQGGMVAQNLAVDPRVTGKYEVESVYMFGSPDTMAGVNTDAKYVSYEAPGDLVPHLDEVVKVALVGSGMGTAFTGSFNDVSNVSEKHIITNTIDAYNPNPYVSHAVYDNPDILTGEPVPFGNGSWNPVSTSGSKISTIGPIIYGGIKETANDVVNKLKEIKML